NCFVDASGDAVIARHAGAPLMNVEPGQHRMGMSLVFRLSHVDVARFRALSRQEKRSITLEGMAAGELFWEVLSVSPVSETDAICLMSHLDGLDSLDPNDLTRAEFIGRYQGRQDPRIFEAKNARICRLRACRHRKPYRCAGKRSARRRLS